MKSEYRIEVGNNDEISNSRMLIITKETQEISRLRKIAKKPVSRFAQHIRSLEKILSGSQWKFQGMKFQGLVLGIYLRHVKNERIHLKKNYCIAYRRMSIMETRNNNLH